MIPNEEKEGWHYLTVKKLLHRKTSKNKGDFYCLICFILLEQKVNLNLMKKYLKIKIFVDL